MNWIKKLFKKEGAEVTSLRDMSKTATPIISIPAWDGVGEIKVRVKRMSLAALVQSGQLPNDLLSFAQDVAEKEKRGDTKLALKPDAESYKKYTELMHAMAKASLVEPTYDEIIENVGALTDQQLLALQAFSVGGLRSLYSFRAATGFIAKDGDDGENIRGKTK